jgi:hypothetical protein
VHPSVVADAGGLLSLAGLVEGIAHEADEICALDASAMLAAEVLELHHEGAPARAAAEYGLLVSIIQEWFPARALAMDAALQRSDRDMPLDSVAALLLAESMTVPLVTKLRDLESRKIPVLYA